MKMKIFAFILLIVGIQACSLDTDNLTSKDSSSFPETSEDLNSALISSYQEAANAVKIMGYQHPFAVCEFNSDQRFGGGGLHDINVQALSQFKISNVDLLGENWKSRYTGIYRANFILESLDDLEDLDPDTKDYVAGQAYFLRAYFYMNLAQVFENVPIILGTSEPDEIKQAAPAETWAQIFSDLKDAISYLPNTTYQELSADKDGTATKWAAEAMIARAFLFYTGVYNDTSAPLTDGTSLSKEEVLAYVDDCVANSGHRLISDFRNLWPYAVSNIDYAYAKDNNLQWVGEEHSNPECIWALKYNGYGDREFSSNDIILGMGIRQQFQVPFGKGWGYGTVNPQAWEDWSDNDLRKVGSIYSVENESSWVSGYIKKSTQAVETGYWQKKYIPINMLAEDGKPTGYETVLYGAYNHFTRNTGQDIMILRFADVLLMGAELGSSKAQTYLDEVRNRVNLTSVPVTLENIKAERNHELAFEGVRYYDLLRWHDAEAAFAKVKDVPVTTGGSATTMTINFRPDTRGFMPIPQTEIDLSNGGIVQNDGWTGAEAAW